MNKRSLIIKNHFNKDLNKTYLTKISKKLQKSIQQIYLEIKNDNKTLNVLREKLNLTLVIIILKNLKI